jgi:RNA polymerase sigma factor (sigma-70 family)
MLQSRDEAQDLVHSLFLDLLQRPSGEPPAGPGGDAQTVAPTRAPEIDLAYLYRAVTNRCLNHLRDRRNQGRLLASHDEALRGLVRTRVDDRVVDRQLLSALSARIDGHDWEVLVYRFVDDMTEDEIAALIGTSRRTVTRQVRRVRDQVRALAGGDAPARAEPSASNASGGRRSSDDPTGGPPKGSP